MQNNNAIMTRTNCCDHSGKEGTMKGAREDSYVCFKCLLSDLLVEIDRVVDYVSCTVADLMLGRLQWAWKVCFLQLSTLPKPLNWNNS